MLLPLITGSSLGKRRRRKEGRLVPWITAVAGGVDSEEEKRHEELQVNATALFATCSNPVFSSPEEIGKRSRTIQGKDKTAGFLGKAKYPRKAIGLVIIRHSGA